MCTYVTAALLLMMEDLDFDKANEILFRLGIIYKQQGKYDDSLACFDRILRNPPSPLAHADIWFQIGHVYEQQKDVSLFCAEMALSLTYVHHSTYKPRMRMNESWPITLFMQRFFNSLVGSITKMVLASRTRSLRFNT